MTTLALRRLWLFVKDNADNVAAIAVCGYAAIHGIASGESLLLSAIAGVLAILAVGSIRDRSARDRLERMMDRQQSIPKVSDVLRSRTDFQPFSGLIASAQHVYMMGPSLASLFTQWSDLFASTKIMEQGCVIEALVIDPYSTALDSAAKNLGISNDDLRHEIDTTIRLGRSICERIGAERPNQFYLGTVGVDLNWSVIFVDPEKPSGVVVVELIGFRTDLHRRPHFVLTRQYDGYWVDFFLRQYRELRRSASNTYE